MSCQGSAKAGLGINTDEAVLGENRPICFVAETATRQVDSGGPYRKCLSRQDRTSVRIESVENATVGVTVDVKERTATLGNRQASIDMRRQQCIRGWELTHELTDKSKKKSPGSPSSPEAANAATESDEEDADPGQSTT